MRGTLLLVLLVLFVMAAGAASAANSVVNGGFETPVLADGASVVGAWPGVVVSNWELDTDTAAIYNPTGDGTASDGMVVEEGNNYLKITDNPSLGHDYTAAFSYVPVTIQANHTYTLRFRYGKTSDLTKTCTRTAVTFGAVNNPGSWDGWIAFSHPYFVFDPGAAGWYTYEYSETVLAGDPKIGKSILIGLGGQTWYPTDAYYYDKVELIDTPRLPSSVSYQGKLTNAQGQAIADTPRNFVFKFYGQETGGVANWTSSTMSITTSGGRFNAQIDNIDAVAAFPSGDAWMEMVVGGETLSPRFKVTAAPYALVSGIVK